MNGLGKVGRGSRGRSSHRSVSIYEAIRTARIMMGKTGSGSSSTILEKDWKRNEKTK